MQERDATPVVIVFIKLFTTGALIIITGGMVLIVLKRPDISGTEAIVFGFSVLSLALASSSGLQMWALTHFNFVDEKMAMMVDYDNSITLLDTENPSKEVDNLEYVLSERQMGANEKNS